MEEKKPDASELKKEGNKAFMSSNFPRAIEMYTQAIEHAGE